MKRPVRFYCRIDGYRVEVLRVIAGNAWCCECPEYAASSGCNHVVRAAAVWARRRARVTDGVTDAHWFSV